VLSFAIHCIELDGFVGFFYFLVNIVFGSIVMDGSVFDAMKHKDVIEEIWKFLIILKCKLGDLFVIDYKC